METEKAQEIEQDHNVYVDADTEMYTNGERDDLYGWMPIPKEWYSEIKMEYDKKAKEIIRRNDNYNDAFSEMMDSGLDSIEADGAWEKFQDQCGADL